MRYFVPALLLFSLPVLPLFADPEMDQLRRDVEESRKALDDLKAAREKLESGAASDPGSLEKLKAEISEQSHELELAMGGELEAPRPGEQLCFAILRKDLDSVTQLLDSGVSPDSKDRFGGSALEAAADGGFADAMKLLIKKGANVNSRGTMGGTPLILASAKGYLEAVRLLLKAGAEVNARAETGVTALKAARNNLHPEVARLLTEAGAKE